MHIETGVRAMWSTRMATLMQMLAVTAIVFLVAACSGGADADRREVAARTGSDSWTLIYEVSDDKGECLALAIDVAGVLAHEHCTQSDEPVAWYMDGVGGVRYTWGRIAQVAVVVEQASAGFVVQIPDPETETTFFVIESSQEAAPTITFLVDGHEIASVDASR